MIEYELCMKHSTSGMMHAKDRCLDCLRERVSAIEWRLGESPDAKEVPVRLVTHCPAGHQHVDEGEWATRAHKTHRCTVTVGCSCGKSGSTCGLEWRPANIYTVGVSKLEES